MTVIKNLPKHWQFKKLGDVCEKITKGGTPTTYGFNFVSSGVNFIKIENIENGNVILKSLRSFITADAHNYQKKSILEENDLLFSIAGTIGETCLIRKEYLPANTNQALAILRGYNKELHPEFLTYQLSSSISQYVKLKARGGAMNNISLEDLKAIELVVPPLTEQHAIVAKIKELFSELENGRQQLLKAQEQLKVYKQSLLKAAFEEKLTNPDVKDGGVPEGWKLTTLGDYLEKIEAGKSFKCEERTPNSSEVGVLKVSALTWQVFNENESKTVIDHTKVNESYFVQRGDFLFSRANTLDLIGAAVIVDSIERKLMLSDKTLRFVFTEEVLKPYVLHYLRSQNGRREIQRLSTGNQESMRNIGQQNIKQIEIPVPDIHEQEKLISILENKLTICDNIAKAINHGLQQAETLRQSILKKAFEGELL